MGTRWPKTRTYAVRLWNAVRRLTARLWAVLRRVLLRRAAAIVEAAEELDEEPASRRLLAEDPLTRLRRIRWRAQASIRRCADDAVTRLLAHTQRQSRRVPRGVDPLPTSLSARDSTQWEEVNGSGGGWEDEDAAETTRQRASIVRQLHDRLGVGAARDLEPALALVDELIDLAIRRPSDLVSLAMNAELSPPAPACAKNTGDACSPSTPAHCAAGGGHSYAVAALAAAIGARLGWREEDVRDAALAGLLADSGMQLVTGQPGTQPRGLDDVEVNRLHRHPVYSVAMAAAARGRSGGGADDAHGASDAALLGMLEHHEREDGTGYPRALHGGQIHDVSRVVAVADCFCAALGDRPFRGPLSPHAALKEVLDMAHAGRLWSDAAHALVSVTGIFPKGTSVVLSDGSSGVSLGIADPARPDRPVVQLRRRGVVLGVLDLAESDARALSVAAALDTPLSETRRAA